TCWRGRSSSWSPRTRTTAPDALGARAARERHLDGGVVEVEELHLQPQRPGVRRGRRAHDELGADALLDVFPEIDLDLLGPGEGRDDVAEVLLVASQPVTVQAPDACLPSPQGVRRVG